MSFFRRIFASTPAIEQVTSAVARKRWADALAFAQGIERSRLSADQLEKLEHDLCIAGDALAAMNLAEGEAWARQGDRLRAKEHLQLARAQGCSPALLADIDAAIERFSTETPEVTPIVLATSACSSGCCPAAQEQPVTTSAEMDMETRLDLILSGYPENYAKRYLTLSAPLIEAVLLAHEGHFDAALEMFKRVERSQQCETFFFERGALFARAQNATQAKSDLQEALRLDPQHLLAQESLVDLLLVSGDPAAARQHLESNSAAKFPPAFRHARLARAHYMQNDPVQALSYAQQAINSGSRDQDTLELAATLYENEHDLDRAEQVLSLLGGGGCSGGQNVPLAEFRFKHGRELPKALETYKSLARVEPANATWLLRIGQIYLRQGWGKEGRAILETLSSSDLAGEEIRKIAVQELGRSASTGE